MDVVSIPIQGVILHAQIVSREISCRVTQVVELVPEDPPSTRGCGYDGNLYRKVDGGEETLTLTSRLIGGGADKRVSN